jgi:hypothetical protein
LTLTFQIVDNLGKLSEGGLEVIDDFLRDHIRIAETSAVFQRLVV